MGAASSSARPRNLLRLRLHIGAGLLIWAGVEMFWQTEVALVVGLGALVWVWTEEVLKYTRWRSVVLKLHASTAHPSEEDGVSSGTWFVTGLFVLTLTADRCLLSAGIGVLTLADPAAAACGRRFGRWRIHGAKTGVGSAAFFATSFLVVISLLMLRYGLDVRAAAMCAVGAAGAATLGELWAWPDDNLLIPIGVGAGLWGTATGFGLALLSSQAGSASL